MKQAKIAYDLTVNFDNWWALYSGGGRRTHTSFNDRVNNTYSNSVTKKNLNAETQDENVGGVDFDKAIESLSEDRQREESENCVQLLNFFNEWNGEDSEALVDAVKAFISKSEVFDDGDQIISFFQKFDATRKLQDEIGVLRENGAINEEEFYMTYKTRMRDIWGKNLRFTNTSAADLANDFDGFADVFKDLGDRDVPMAFSTKVTYALNIKEKQIPWDLKRGLVNAFTLKDLLFSTVEYKDLPARLFKLQEQLLGGLPEDLPQYRICLDHLGDSKETVYRLSAEGNTEQELVERLKAKMEELGVSSETDYMFRLTVHSYADQSGFFHQPEPSKNADALLASIIDDPVLSRKNTRDNQWEHERARQEMLAYKASR